MSRLIRSSAPIIASIFSRRCPVTSSMGTLRLNRIRCRRRPGKNSERNSRATQIIFGAYNRMSIFTSEMHPAPHGQFTNARRSLETNGEVPKYPSSKEARNPNVAKWNGSRLAQRAAALWDTRIKPAHSSYRLRQSFGLRASDFIRTWVVRHSSLLGNTLRLLKNQSCPAPSDLPASFPMGFVVNCHGEPRTGSFRF